MYEQIKQYAMYKFAGDAEAQADFLAGFEKEAFSGEHLIEGLGKGLGAGLAGMAIAGGISGLGAAYKTVNNSNLHTKFLASLSQAISSNPILRSAEKDKVMSYAETVFKFAPHVATDPNLLSSILANAVHGEGVDPLTIKTLVDLNGRHVDNNTFNPKSYT